MADSVSNEWDRGNTAVVGTPSTGYPFCTLSWNIDDVGSSSDELVTPNMNFQLGQRGRSSFSIVINVDADGVDNSATLALKVYGSNTNDSTLSKWEVLDTVGTIANADVSSVAYTHVYNIDTKGLMPYMKISLKPNTDPDELICKVGIIPGAI